MSDWLEDKHCKACGELVSVGFGLEFVNGLDCCYDCLSDEVERLRDEVERLRKDNHERYKNKLLGKTRSCCKSWLSTLWLRQPRLR